MLQRICLTDYTGIDAAWALLCTEVVGWIRMDRFFNENTVMFLQNDNLICATNSFAYLFLSLLRYLRPELFQGKAQLPILRAIGQRLYDSAEVIEFYSRIFGHYNLRVGQDI